MAIAMISSNAFADLHIRDIKGKDITIKTPISASYFEGMPDIYYAVAVGDKVFVSNTLATDKELFKKFNKSDPEEIIGFNSYNLEMINLVLSSDPELLSRIPKNNSRNMASTLLFNHWDELTYQKDIDYFLKYEGEIQKMGVRMKEGTTLIKKDRKLLEDMVIAVSANMPQDALNQKDIFGNTILHYAVGRNMPNVVNYLLSNNKFVVSSAFNQYKESAIFMLIDNSCKFSPEEKANAQEVLKGLLKARTSLFQRNISGFTFPALVYGLPGLDYLATVLNENLSPVQREIFKKESLFVVAELKKGDEKKLYSSIQRNGYWTSSCRYFEDKENKEPMKKKDKELDKKKDDK